MRLTVTAIAVALAALALWTGPALAEGLPQLDHTKFAPQLVWLAISFVALYLIMSRMTLPKVAQVLEERQQKIDENLRKAETLKAEAEAAAEAYEQALADARSKAQDVLRQVHNELAGEAATRNAELTARLTDEVAAAEARIATARDEALSKVSEMAVEVTHAAVERLTGESLDEKTVAKAVDGVIGGSS